MDILELKAKVDDEARKLCYGYEDKYDYYLDLLRKQCAHYDIEEIEDFVPFGNYNKKVIYIKCTFCGKIVGMKDA
jgi:hypothetical protein